ncbi:hypothetical protein [Dyella kyungheensis]|jgi:hypothetical protein|uniref:Uncharacterized protein n=1 Tax=Dyella kyungheensis TaxID=1242174 RepID=A0ABS2JT52_9GAMM|nr:hypothetical protein [Dyella kyungheensis]MBM7121759.1 hypothetical protein [Dyella kyungheensis]
MKANNLLALTAAALFTTVGLAAINSNVKSLPIGEINGVKVIDLAPVEVRPTADDMRSAALLTDAGIATLNVAPLLASEATAHAALGSQLAMPYYSFGSTKFGRISKD